MEMSTRFQEGDGGWHKGLVEDGASGSNFFAEKMKLLSLPFIKEACPMWLSSYDRNGPHAAVAFFLFNRCTCASNASINGQP